MNKYVVILQKQQHKAYQHYAKFLQKSKLNELIAINF